ncbi:MAG: hypothetical protein LBO66_06140 [Deltaproteobacteria bacterium]|jgi:hypothetical protein|nr:hypothetical protein [Deltaproteobacteria bacterium]
MLEATLTKTKIRGPLKQILDKSLGGAVERHGISFLGTSLTVKNPREFKKSLAYFFKTLGPDALVALTSIVGSNLSFDVYLGQGLKLKLANPRARKLLRDKLFPTRAIDTPDIDAFDPDLDVVSSQELREAFGETFRLG